METIKCPCCGGQTTNFLNCDYCGSYLVRFTKRNLNYDKSKLGSDALAIRGLQEELQKNLEEQILSNGKNHVITEISCGDRSIQVMNPRAIGDCIIKQNKNADARGTAYPQNPFIVDDIALVICMRIYDTLHDTKLDRFDGQEKIEWLDHIGIKPLFVQYDDPLYEYSLGIKQWSGTCHSYYLYIGKDCAGASKIISQYFFGSNSIDKKSDKLNFNHRSDSEFVYLNNLNNIQRNNKVDVVMQILGLCLGSVLGYIWVVRNDTNEIGHILYCFMLISIILIFFGPYWIYRLKHRNKE